MWLASGSNLRVSDMALTESGCRNSPTDLTARPVLFCSGSCPHSPEAVNGTVCAGSVGGMADTPTTPRRRGAVRTEELLRTTLDIAAQDGYAGLTIEAVAKRAGVGKHTIYRRWPSKAALIMDALSHVWISDLNYRDTGDIRADLREQFLRSSAALAEPPIGPVYRAAIAEAQADPALRDELHQRFLATVEERTLDRITRAQHSGELVADADLTLAAEILCGALYYRHLLSTRSIGAAEVDALLEMFFSTYSTHDATACPSSEALRSATEAN